MEPSKTSDQSKKFHKGKIMFLPQKLIYNIKTSPNRNSLNSKRIIKDRLIIKCFQNYWFNRMIFYIIIFLLFKQNLFDIVQSSKVSAIDPQCPFRTGKIYISFIGQPTINGSTIINFDDHLLGISDIILSIRTLFTVQTQKSCLDYEIYFTDLSETGFNLTVVRNTMFNINYDSMISDYWAFSPVQKFLGLSQISSSSFSAQSNADYSKFSTTVSSISIAGSNASFASFFSFTKFIANFSDYNFTIFRQSPINNYNANTISLQYSFSPNAIITDFVVAGIIYDLNGDVHVNYTLTLFTITIDASQVTQTYSGKYSYATGFMGWASVKEYNSTFPTQISFSFGYQNQPFQNSTLSYLQEYPQNVQLRSQSSTLMIYQGFYFYFSRKGCPDTIQIYFEPLTQLCYDKCPVGQYANSNMQCKFCSDCTQIQNCSECYNNGCDISYYFDNTTFTCLLCSSHLIGSETCFSNSSGIFCLSCASTYFLDPVTSQCNICASYLSNCSTCTTNHSQCLSCLNSSETELTNGQCVSCNVSSYFRYNDSKCHSCSLKVLNCYSCSLSPSNITCTQCEPGFELNSNGQCNPCNSTSYSDPSQSVCYQCSSVLLNCESCRFPLLNNCTSCLASSQTELINGQCVPCDNRSYYNSFDKRCYQCSSNVTYCDACIFSTNVECSSCDVNYLAELINASLCQTCNSTSYFDYSDKKCHLCNLLISNCEECGSPASNNCTRCDISSQMEVVNGICQPCNSSSYFDSSTMKCNLCQNSISNCQQCTLNFQISCTKCKLNFQLQPLTGQCKSCSDRQYFNNSNLTCNFCQTAIPGCLSCQIDILNNVVCKCNFDLSNNSSSLPPCTQPIQPIIYPVDVTPSCPLSTFNQSSKRCELNLNQKKSVQVITTISSIPALNTMTNSLSSLTGLLDDLSYYTYHQRNYSKQVAMFFQQMTNFTLSRFIPFQMDTISDKLNYSYSNLILTKYVGQFPLQFQQNDQSIHFLITTQDLWIRTFPLTIFIFLVLMFIHWFLNLFIKNNLFKKNSYIGMIFVSILSPNIQFLSFKCFSQMYQIVPLGAIYYFNICFCYTILFFVLIYCLNGIIIFIALYNRAPFKYVVGELFGEEWMIWFMMSNLIKFSTGFIHAYFYNYVFLQNTFLSIAYFVKVLVFALSLKYMHGKFYYSFQLISSCLFLLFQVLLFAELILQKIGTVDNNIFNYTGEMQSFLIVLMIVCQVLRIIIFLAKDVITYLIWKYFRPFGLKKNTKDVFIIKNPSDQINNSKPKEKVYNIPLRRLGYKSN